jgi:hypothetical protein
MQKRKIESTQVRITVKRLKKYLNFKKKNVLLKNRAIRSFPYIKTMMKCSSEKI